jgi:hypothetical protein
VRRPSILILLLLILGLMAGGIYFYPSAPVSSDPDLPFAEGGEGPDVAEVADAGAGNGVPHGQPIRELDPGAGLGDSRVTYDDTAVMVIDPDGRPVPNARVIPWVGKELQVEGITGKLGVVSFDLLKGSGGFMVLAPDYLPAYFLRNFETDPMLLELPRGETVAVQVKFVGPRYSPKPISMRFVSAARQDPPGVPARVLASLDKKNLHTGSTEVHLDQNDSFQMQGLPQAWTGKLLSLPGAMFHAIHGPGVLVDSTEAQLVAASENFVLEVKELPGFSGRIVTPDSTQGVEGVSFFLYATISNIDNVRTLGGISLADGTFYSPLWMGSDDEYESWSAEPEAFRATSAHLTLTGTEHWAGGERSLDLTNQSDPWALGDIPMAEWHLQKIHVVDELGQAIAGALAFAGAISKPTDANGDLEVQVWPWVETIAVNAKGYALVTQSLLNQTGGTMEFVLPQAVRITVKWPLSTSIDMSTVQFQLKSEADIFAGEERMGSSLGIRFRKALGAWYRSGSFGRKGGFVNYPIKPNQAEFFLWGLNPGVGMEVSLIGAAEAVLSTSGPLTFSAGEYRVIELPMPTNPLDFIGKVVDPNGLALSGVSLEVQSQQYRYEAKSTEEGEFSFAGLGGSTLEITLRKPGSATVFLEDYATPADGSAVEIVMEPSRELTVFLRDESGQNLRGGFIRTDSTWSEQLEQADFYLIKDVPLSSFELEWSLGGATAKAQIPAAVTEHVIPVPAMASALLHLSRLQSTTRESLKIQFFSSDNQATEASPSYSKSASLEVGEKELSLGIPSLQPGKYRVTLSAWQQGTDSWGYQLLDEQSSIGFTAGETTELSLRY